MKTSQTSQVRASPILLCPSRDRTLEADFVLTVDKPSSETQHIMSSISRPLFVEASLLFLARVRESIKLPLTENYFGHMLGELE